MTAALQALAASLCLIAQVLMDVVQGQFHPWHFVWPVLAFGGAALTRRVANMRQLFLVGLFNVQTVVIGFAVLTRLADDPGFWFLPIGLCVTLTTATIYHRVQDFVFGSGLTWVTLSLIVQPVLDSGVKQVFVPVIIIGSMVAGVASSILFRSYRSQSYRAQRQLHQSANMDPLTELPNRRAFTESWKRLQQSATEPLVFMMADIDNFKRINDDFGHDVGAHDAQRIEIAAQTGDRNGARRRIVGAVAAGDRCGDAIGSVTLAGQDRALVDVDGIVFGAWLLRWRRRGGVGSHRRRRRAHL